jgi:hypothetical protein
MTTTAPVMLQEFTRKGWIIRPLSPADDLDELDRADLEAALDEQADQEACILYGTPQSVTRKPVAVQTQLF